jgi:arsenate reductase
MRLVTTTDPLIDAAPLLESRAKCVMAADTSYNSFGPIARPAPEIWGRKRLMAKRMTIYGIKACDTMKKARDWLDDRAIGYVFHDYKTLRIDRGTLESWVDRLNGWETLLNRAGTTFRKLPDADKADLDRNKAIGLMLTQPSMIKRPVLDLGDRLIVGFKPDDYAAALE